jgi:hypothetical protein
MRLAAWPVAGMALMKMRLVDHVEVVRRESLAQLVRDNVLDGLIGIHGRGNTSATAIRQCAIRIESFAMSRLEAFRVALS